MNLGDTPFISLNLVAFKVSAREGLLALMAILAQSLLALVSSHLVALLLLSVWHNVLSINDLLFKLFAILSPGPCGR